MNIPDPENFIDTVEEAVLYGGWTLLQDYLSTTGKYLREATEKFETRVREQERGLAPAQFNEFEIDHVDENIFYHDELPYILHNSFFVSAYFLLEYDIKKICKVLKDRKQIPINLSNLKGNLLDRLKLYFKLAGLDFSNKIWPEITNYAKVRNCIVHSNGLLKESDRDYKELIKYIRKEGLIKERVIISGEAAEQEIGLTEKFCKEVVETMQKFIDAAYKDSMMKR